VIGGPAIGLGGGAASSMPRARAGDLDFASVRRDSAEMQRRCREVIDACVRRWATESDQLIRRRRRRLSDVARAW
jgi:phosphoribosylformylglycinamidine synthase